MKKIIVSITLVALMVTALPVSASAYHGGGRHHMVARQSSYSLCSVEGCNTTGNHSHDGTTYTGHTSGDGHGYHQNCTVDGCTQTGSHQHNGTAGQTQTNGTTGRHNGSGHRRGSHH